jgi:hypothetical protein
MNDPHNIIIADELYKFANAMYEWYPIKTVLGVSFVLAVMKTITDPAQPTPEPEPQPEPIGTRICGPRRDLIALQRAWADAEDATAPYQPAPHPAADIAISADDAFAQWFTASIRLPDNPEPSDVIPVEHWARSYTAFCNRNGFPRLSEADLEDRMREYAEANGSTVEQGVFIGGQLIG